MTSTLTVDSETGTRSYAYPAYLRPNLHRENLMVLTDTYITKVRRTLSPIPSPTI